MFVDFDWDANSFAAKLKADSSKKGETKRWFIQKGWTTKIYHFNISKWKTNDNKDNPDRKKLDLSQPKLEKKK